MDDGPIDRKQALNALPPESTLDLLEPIRALVARVDRKIIVLDDDPTGTQTVHDIPVVTRWTTDHLARELADPAPASYVLTNSRSLTAPAANALNREIALNLCAARQRTGRDFVVISRSDSTLRGHFPDEMEVLQSELRQDFDAWVLCPFFEEGGRLTIGDVHYVAEGDSLIPCALTPFAADDAFGFRQSNLRRWVTEKSQGRIPADRMTSLSLTDLRSAGGEKANTKIRELAGGSVCIVNAVTRQDLRVAVRALLEAEAAGKRFLYRTAASFVAARAGIDARPLLLHHDLRMTEGRGVLVAVGSHVPKTSAQLGHLLDHGNVLAVELEVAKVLETRLRDDHVSQVADQLARRLAGGGVAVVFTSREVVRGDAESSLAVSRQVSAAMVDVICRLSQRPRAMVAKGGITSSDLATQGCGIERATVLGQILPGVPVWRCGQESRFPGMPYVSILQSLIPLFHPSLIGSEAPWIVVNSCIPEPPDWPCPLPAVTPRSSRIRSPGELA